MLIIELAKNFIFNLMDDRNRTGCISRQCMVSSLVKHFSENGIIDTFPFFTSYFYFFFFYFLLLLLTFTIQSDVFIITVYICVPNKVLSDGSMIKQFIAHAFLFLKTLATARHSSFFRNLLLSNKKKMYKI